MNDTTFLLPDLGEGLTDAEILQWHVSEGDHVTTDQPLVSVETDKAVVEIPAPRSGVVERLHAAVGDRVAVGAPLLEFHEGRAADAGAIVGELDAGERRDARLGEKGGEEVGEQVVDEVVDEVVNEVVNEVGEEVGEEVGRQIGDSAPAGRVAAPRAAPAARRLAREAGIDLTAVAGSGPGGVIGVDDVRRAAARASAGAAPEPSSAQLVVVAPASGSPEAGASGEPLRGARRAMAERMRSAHAEVALATVTGRADIDAWASSAPLMPRLVRATVAACRQVPALNAWFHTDAQRRQLHDRVDLGIAVDTREGLFVPVLRDAGARTLEATAAELETLEAAVRERSIAPDALRGATITLSNFGAIGGIFATMIVVPPQVAILGAGRATREVLATHDGVCLHVVLPISLSFDHRVVTGGEAAAFLHAVIDDLESNE